ncbi:MAG: hypothetical protein PWP24_312 [Clostridiales bacterium]|nr:hypothetical protein [Clostridiales bacterium]
MESNKIDFAYLIATVEQEIPKKRFLHTLSVSTTAACLSMHYSEDIKKARLAGLLHDIAKCLSDEEIYSQCLENNIPITDTERKNLYLLHAKLGAFYAKSRFLIEDKEVLNAIQYHTTGRPAMSMLEKIIFLADYIEPGRKEIPGLAEIRTLSFENIDLAVYLTLKNTLVYLQSITDNADIDEMTIQAYEYYKQLMERST